MSMSNDRKAVSVPGFDLPESVFVAADSPGKCQSFFDFFLTLTGGDVITADTPNSKIPAIREQIAQAFYQSPVYAELCQRYPCTHRVERMGGVVTEVFEPDKSGDQKAQDKVLINFHGGGFQMGARTVSHLESRPIASKAGIKVVSVDYRMWPEHQHPAALEDAIAVYRALLTHYRPENIGVYGCSAGAVLTAHLIAYLIREQLPLPKAAGMFCASAKGWLKGDSGAFVSAMMPPDSVSPSETEMLYFKGTECAWSPLLPGDDPDIMRRFPPSLLISSMRDYAVSSVVATHAQLVALGVEADLHIWDGLYHAFTLVPDLREAQQAVDVIVNFFHKQLKS